MSVEPLRSRIGLSRLVRDPEFAQFRPRNVFRGSDIGSVGSYSS